MELGVAVDLRSSLAFLLVDCQEELRRYDTVDSRTQDHIVLGEKKPDAVGYRFCCVDLNEDLAAVSHAGDWLVLWILVREVDVVSLHSIESGLLDELPGLLASPMDHFLVLEKIHINFLQQLILVDTPNAMPLCRSYESLPFLSFHLESFLRAVLDYFYYIFLSRSFE